MKIDFYCHNSANIVILREKYYTCGTRLDLAVSRGYYWSSSLSDGPSYAWYVNFGPDGVARYGAIRCIGMSAVPFQNNRAAEATCK